MGKRVESPTEGKEMICGWKPFNIQVIFFGFQILLVKSMLVTTLLGSLKSNWSKWPWYVSTAQTVSTIWPKQCAEEFLNQEAIYLPILEADHVRMILSSTAWPHLFVRADVRILIPFQPYYADEYLFMAIPLILNCFVASLSLLQMDRIFLEVAYPACPLYAVSGKPTRDESKHPIRKRLEEQKFVPNRRHNR